MTPLVDGDILLHELGWSGQFKDKDTGEEVLLSFEHVQELVDAKIEGICYDVDATEEPILFITNSEWISKTVTKSQRYSDREACGYTPNFRYAVAKTRPYKGTRNNPKPFHFYNIVSHLLANYNVVISRGGLEADDMICLEQSYRNDNPDLGESIICSRDKDLRICPGWHFSWECGKQKAIGPVYTNRIGSLELVEKTSTNQTTGKVTKTRELKGFGLKFFFSQMLTGDVADNIPGLPKVGAVAAYNILNELESEKEMFDTVRQAYKDKFGDEAKEMFKEQKALLWMKQKDMWEYKYES